MACVCVGRFYYSHIYHKWIAPDTDDTADGDLEDDAAADDDHGHSHGGHDDGDHGHSHGGSAAAASSNGQPAKRLLAVFGARIARLSLLAALVADVHGVLCALRMMHTGALAVGVVGLQTLGASSAALVSPASRVLLAAPHRPLCNPQIELKAWQSVIGSIMSWVSALCYFVSR